MSHERQDHQWRLDSDRIGIQLWATTRQDCFQILWFLGFILNFILSQVILPIWCHFLFVPRQQREFLTDCSYFWKFLLVDAPPLLGLVIQFFNLYRPFESDSSLWMNLWCFWIACQACAIAKISMAHLDLRPKSETQDYQICIFCLRNPGH